MKAVVQAGTWDWEEVGWRQWCRQGLGNGKEWDGGSGAGRDLGLGRSGMEAVVQAGTWNWEEVGWRQWCRQGLGTGKEWDGGSGAGRDLELGRSGMEAVVQAGTWEGVGCWECEVTSSTAWHPSTTACVCRSVSPTD